MSRLGPLIFGLTGAGILIALGVWQMQRLDWKQGVLAEITARIVAEPVNVPGAFDPVADKYQPVKAEGTLEGEFIRVLVSQKRIGAGYRIISPIVLPDGRKILVDRGIAPVDAAIPAPPADQVSIIGNLHWPDEVDGFTPDPDLAGNIWFARDVPAMATSLGTEPAMIVVRDVTFDDAPIVPAPVDTAGIPNDHLQYAITWFSLAVIWLGMTAYFLRRQSAETKRT